MEVDPKKVMWSILSSTDELLISGLSLVEAEIRLCKEQNQGGDFYLQPTNQKEEP